MIKRILLLITLATTSLSFVKFKSIAQEPKPTFTYNIQSQKLAEEYIRIKPLREYAFKLAEHKVNTSLAGYASPISFAYDNTNFEDIETKLKVRLTQKFSNLELQNLILPTKLLNLDQPPAVIEVYNEAIKGSSHEVSRLAQLESLRSVYSEAYANKQNEKVLKAFEELALQLSKDADYHSFLGDVYLSFGDETKAESSFRRSLDISSVNPRAHYGLWSLYYSRNLEQAEKHYSDLIANERSNDMYHHLLCLVKYYQKQYNQAIKLCEESLLLSSVDRYTSYSKRYTLAHAYYNNYLNNSKTFSDLEKAKSTFENIIRQRMVRNDIYINSIISHLYILLRLSKYEEVEKAARKASDMGYSIPLSSILAVIASKNNALEDLKRYLRQAEMERKDMKAEEIYNIACLFAVHGLKEEAFSWLEIAVKMSADVRAHMANDPEMDSLKGDVRFQELLKKY